jgi:hypothetical protein
MASSGSPHKNACHPLCMSMPSIKINYLFPSWLLTSLYNFLIHLHKNSKSLPSKIIMIIICYTLNSSLPICLHHSKSWKISIISIFKNEVFFGGKIIICFFNVETNPRATVPHLMRKGVEFQKQILDFFFLQILTFDLIPHQVWWN